MTALLYLLYFVAFSLLAIPLGLYLIALALRIVGELLTGRR